MLSIAATGVVMFPFFFNEPKRSSAKSPDQLLIGTRRIAEWLGIGVSSLYCWMQHDFPVVRLPDSHQRYATTPRLINQWLKDMRRKQRAAVEASVRGEKADPHGSDP